MTDKSPLDKKNSSPSEKGLTGAKKESNVFFQPGFIPPKREIGKFYSYS
jgi:hypothetical protein